MIADRSKSGLKVRAFTLRRSVFHRLFVALCIVGACSGNILAGVENTDENLAQRIQTVQISIEAADTAAIDKALAPLSSALSGGQENPQLDEMLRSMVSENNDMLEWFVGSRLEKISGGFR